MDVYKNKIIEQFERYSDARVLGLLAFGVVAILVTWSGVKVVQTNYELEKKIAVAKQRNSVQELKNENLKLKNQYYQSSQYLELSARRQFGKAAPGEKLYNVPENVALSKTIEPLPLNADTADVQQQYGSKYEKNINDWLRFLFH